MTFKIHWEVSGHSVYRLDKRGPMLGSHYVLFWKNFARQLKAAAQVAIIMGLGTNLTELKLSDAMRSFHASYV